MKRITRVFWSINYSDPRWNVSCNNDLVRHSHTPQPYASCTSRQISRTELEIATSPELLASKPRTLVARQDEVDLWIPFSLSPIHLLVDNSILWPSVMSGRPQLPLLPPIPPDIAKLWVSRRFIMYIYRLTIWLKNRPFGGYIQLSERPALKEVQIFGILIATFLFGILTVQFCICPSCLSGHLSAHLSPRLLQS
jgi:hypothetical protein